MLVSHQAPSACHFEAPHPVAERLGAMDAKQQWQKPEKQTPIPPALEPAIPPHECVAPGCEKLWAIAEIDVANNPVAWAGAVNWFQVGDPAQQCSWKHDQFSGFFIPSLSGPPVKIDRRPDRRPSARAIGRARRSSGAHVLIADGPGEYATYDSRPARRRSVTTSSGCSLPPMRGRCSITSGRSAMPCRRRIRELICLAGTTRLARDWQSRACAS